MTFFFVEICAKRVELIKEAIPALSRIAVLINPANPSHLLALSAMQGMASALGAELVPVEAKGRDDIAATIATMTARRAQALVAIDDPLFISIARQIAELALQNSVPMIGFKPQAEAGALMDYGVDLADLYSRSAAFVDKILKGTPPADLPIERAVQFELVVNLKTAKVLGIELPTSILLRANEVIEVNRREVITLLGGAAAWPAVVRAQRARLPTIGFLGANTAMTDSHRLTAFVQRLRELGWAEGHNVAIEVRWGEGRAARFAEIAAEFVRLKVDVIVTSGYAPIAAAKHATSAIPIVFAATSDAVGSGLVSSLARSGGTLPACRCSRSTLPGSD